jgi:hypothetical protein
VASLKSRCSGCEPAAQATESFPVCPPGPAVPRRVVCTALKRPVSRDCSGYWVVASMAVVV